MYRKWLSIEDSFPLFWWLTTPWTRYFPLGKPQHNSLLHSRNLAYRRWTSNKVWRCTSWASDSKTLKNSDYDSPFKTQWASRSLSLLTSTNPTELTYVKKKSGSGSGSADHHIELCNNIQLTRELTRVEMKLLCPHIQHIFPSRTENAVPTFLWEPEWDCTPLQETQSSNLLLSKFMAS